MNLGNSFLLKEASSYSSLDFGGRFGVGVNYFSGESYCADSEFPL